jgi:hypothetical protein
MVKSGHTLALQPYLSVQLLPVVGQLLLNPICAPWMLM